MSHSGILLRGQGVAAATAAHLLNRAGLAFARERGSRPATPVIMLSDAALALLRDVLGEPALFAQMPRIEQRVVRWGSPEAVTMPHRAVVVAQDDLEKVLDLLPSGNIQQSGTFNGDFTIHAMAPFPAGETLRFGERLSCSARVVLDASAPAGTCWIEAVREGWLFLIPDGSGAAWLLAVGGDPQRMAENAPMIGPLINAMAPANGTFDTSPRMLVRLAEGGWLACGTAAIAFDPICGDGTAQAAREGLLASAVVSALARGEDASLLAMHYHSLLLASLRRHLQLSLPFYASGGSGRWWHDQYAAARAGYDRTTALLGALPEPRFALRGFDLVRREQAA